VGRVALAVHGRGTQAAGIEARTRAGQVEAAYLQLVMQALWQRERNAKSNVLRLATLEAMGGATDVVQAHVDAVTGTLSPTQQAMAARTLHFLVTSSGTKIAHTTGDLSRYADVDPERLRELLDRLCAGNAWLLRRTAPQGG